MKVLTLAFVLAAFCALSSDAARCFTRKEKVALRDLMVKMKCEAPMGQLVNLPVPEGFSHVVPSMSKVNRCSGLLCWGKNKGCMPTKLDKKQVKVEAFMKGEKSMECRMVEVDEHFECGCECRITAKDCFPDQVFNDEMCHCDTCREGAMTECMNKEGGQAAWQFNENNCMCSCVDPSVCEPSRD